MSNLKLATEIYEQFQAGASISDIVHLLDNKDNYINHDWYCGCGHWNGANLATCALCGRTPGESR